MSGWGDEIDAADPFALPPERPLSGVVLDSGQAIETLHDADRELVPSQIAEGAAQAVQLFRNPDAVRSLSSLIKQGLVERLRALYAEVRAQRRDGRVTAELVAAELQLLADAADSLRAVGQAIKAGEDEAKAIAGELVAEVADTDSERGGSRSVRVGDLHGTDVKVTRTQPTKVSADTEKLIDVLVTGLVAEYARGDHDLPTTTAYAKGARESIEALRRLVSPLAWKTSALDEWARKLEAVEEHDLAIRLGHAYGRVPTGNAQVKIERVEPKR